MVHARRKGQKFPRIHQDPLLLRTHPAIQEGQTYAKYQVALPHNYQVGDIGDIFVHVVYLYRYVNLPASITLHEDQKLQYEDVKYLVSPYHILDHESTYKFAKL
jgi:hypothetical protein